MSWARWGAGSAVYVFENMSGQLECCSCPLRYIDGGPFSFTTADVEQFITHLRQHEQAGQHVPATLPDALRDEYGSTVPA